MKIKDLVMIGIIVGIALFFIGAIISNVFPASESNIVPYRVTAIIKLLGLGMVTTTMVVGGLMVKNIDNNLRLLLLVLGLVLLIIYAVLSPALEWRIPGWADEDDSAYDFRPTTGGIPGFEVPGLVVALGVMVMLGWLKRKRVSV
ncbi:MAG: hypothetical protein KKC68_07265 [Candidatus Thermoplasmatota archaeon]|nr:hypothetical protein [Candidatus Thermoplasmatota archaeon]MBU1941558.1 hypothetical protein [Candidatus Thermoplasmatota archaeon]